MLYCHSRSDADSDSFANHTSKAACLYVEFPFTCDGNQAPALIISRYERKGHITCLQQMQLHFIQIVTNNKIWFNIFMLSFYLKYDSAHWPQQADSGRRCQFPCGHKHIHLDPISPPMFRELRHLSPVSPLSPPYL